MTSIFKLVSRRIAAVVPLLAIALIGCGGGGSSGGGGGGGGGTSCNFVTGQVTTSAGRAQGGGGYPLGLGVNWLSFSNFDLTVYGGVNRAEIVDVGPICLDQISSFPGGGTLGAITVFVGDVYAVHVLSPDAYAKFKVNSYSGGVLTVTYVPHM